MSEPNPYSPPMDDSATTTRRRRTRWVFRVVRFVVGVWGLMVLINPERPGNVAYHQGQTIGRAIGAIMLFVAVFPFGKLRKSAEPDDSL